MADQKTISLSGITFEPPNDDARTQAEQRLAAKPVRQRYRGAQVSKENLFELADALGLDEEVLRKRNYTTPQLVDLLVAQGQTLVFAAKALDMWKREAERLTKKFQAALAKNNADD